MLTYSQAKQEQKNCKISYTKKKKFENQNLL